MLVKETTLYLGYIIERKNNYLILYSPGGGFIGKYASSDLKRVKGIALACYMMSQPMWREALAKRLIFGSSASDEEEVNLLRKMLYLDGHTNVDIPLNKKNRIDFSILK